MANNFLAAPGDKYGGSIADASPVATKDATATVSVAPVVQPRLAGFTSPQDPMFWFGVVAALGVGLMAYSTAAVQKG